MTDTDKNIKRNLWMYPLGTVGRDMVYQLFNSYILTYIMLTRQLTAGQLLAITGIMIAARIFDAANDPIMGFIIEKTRTKWGKFKPWLAIGMLTTAGVVITIYNTTLQGWGFVVLFGIIYFLYSITYTMHDISYWGMIPSLSSDSGRRNQLTSRAVLFAGIGSTLAGMLIPALTVGSNKLASSTQKSYGIVSIAICAIALLFICFTIFGVKENKSELAEQAKEAKRKKIKDIIRTIVKNKPLLWIIVAFILQQIGNSLILGGIGQTYIYFQYGYEGGKYSLFNTIGVMATAVLMVGYPMIAKKLHRKQLMTIMLFVAIAGYALMIISGLGFIPSGIAYWVLVIGFMLSNFGQYGFYLVMMISILNTVEYNEYISGDRDEAVISSVRPFVTKLSSAIIVGITSIVYLIFKVTASTNAISDIDNSTTLGDAKKATQINEIISGISSNTKMGLLFAMVIIPLVMFIGAYLVYMKKYTLDESEYDRICAELAERHAKEDAENAEAPEGQEEAVPAEAQTEIAQEDPPASE